MTLPASATLSVSHRINDRWTVMGDISRTAWSTAFDQVTVDYASNQPDSVLKFGYEDTTFPVRSAPSTSCPTPSPCAVAWPTTKPRPATPTATCACRT